MNNQPKTHPACIRRLIALAVGLLTFALYLQTWNFEHVRLDDGVYALEQPMIEGGVTWAGLKWAFTNRETANLQPVTWISLMLDTELWGVNMGAIHLHNALLHAVNAGLLFLFLVALLRHGRVAHATWRGKFGGAFRGTGNLPVGTAQANGEASAAEKGHGRVAHAPERNVLLAAAFGALFWSLHPLRAESVAWVSSRKDVLAGLFCLLGLLAWLKNVRAYYGEQPRFAGWNVFSSPALVATAEKAPSQFSPLFSFVLTLLLFILGYGAKPTMMIFPGFLALTEWLLAGRVRWRPLAVMGAVVVGFGWLTVFAQEIAIDRNLEGVTRLFNGFVAYLTYWSDTVAPHDLCLFYPYGLNLAYWKIAVGGLAAALSLAAAVLFWKRCPVVPFLFGWFFCGLVPVIGFIHVGIASHADRYTYLPALGISVALAQALLTIQHAWFRGQASDPKAVSQLNPSRAKDAKTPSGPASFAPWRTLREINSFFIAVGGLSGTKRKGNLQAAAAYCLLFAVLAVYAWLASRQIATWKNNYTVFSQATRAVPENAKAWQQLGSEYANRYKNPDEAVACYRKSLTFHDTDECAGQLLYTLALRGKPGDFEEVKEKAAKVAADPELDNYCGGVMALGVVAMREQRWPEAVRYLSVVARKKPTPQVYLWYATSLYQTGQIREAIEHFREVEETAPKAEDRAAARVRLETIRQKHGHLFPARP